MKIDGHTRIYAHIGYPTSSFKAPLIYNPYFAEIGANAYVVPFGVTAADFAFVAPAIFKLTNVGGALITMPHKAAILSLLDRVSVTATIVGACNAVRRDSDGALVGDMFDGAGFIGGLRRKQVPIAGRSALVVGAGGVGSAIAAALAAEGLGHLKLVDLNPHAAAALRDRLAPHYPAVAVTVGDDDPAGCDIVVNASPLGMKASDPMPVNVAKIAPQTFVGDVVMASEITPFLAAAQARGCSVQIGIDMLFEQIPAYLAFFGYPPSTSDHLRAIAQISY